MSKQGTEWTEPGTGTLADILLMDFNWTRRTPAAESWGCKAIARARGNLERMWASHRTNLRLTGEPLTAEDVQRIAECK